MLLTIIGFIYLAFVLQWLVDTFKWIKWHELTFSMKVRCFIAFTLISIFWPISLAFGFWLERNNVSNN